MTAATLVKPSHRIGVLEGDEGIVPAGLLLRLLLQDHA
jgi:hypothetical protein